MDDLWPVSHVGIAGTPRLLGQIDYISCFNLIIFLLKWSNSSMHIDEV